MWRRGRPDPAAWSAAERRGGEGSHRPPTPAPTGTRGQALLVGAEIPARSAPAPARSSVARALSFAAAY